MEMFFLIQFNYYSVDTQLPIILYNLSQQIFEFIINGLYYAKFVKN